ncbi:MAG: long-chain fatty acid--CoA ligase [Ignavibacteriaceae bacterium]|nr:long-chain fatty acid--CoA ligase [Ignavibacteriaceae bacterium]
MSSTNFNTVPELYKVLMYDYGKDSSAVMMQYKPDREYVDITYHQAKEEIEKLAYGLLSLGVKPDDKVAIIAENRPEWIFSDFAILGIGAIDVPLYPSLTADRIEYILNNSESVGIVVSTGLQLNKVKKVMHECPSLKFVIVMNEKDTPANEDKIYSFKNVQEMGSTYRESHPGEFDKLIESCDEDSLCTIIYTSGTTGVEKGVMLSHKNIMSNVKACLKEFELTEKDTFLSFLPLCHIFERMGGYYTGLATGGKFAFAQSIETTAQNLLEIKPTIMTAVPRLFERIYSKVMKNVEAQPEKKQKIFHWALGVGKQFANEKRAGSVSLGTKLKHKIADAVVLKKIREKTGGNMRFFISGGAALSKDLGEFFEAVGIIIIEGYGLTESSPVITANRFNNYKFGTVGFPLPGVEVRLTEEGEIIAKGPNIMKGYFKMPEETEKTIKDGWLYTGDKGEFDEEGRLRITDRIKHLFKTSGGKYVAPTPIENMFLSSKFIEQFVLIGDKRMFLSALIVPDFESVKEYADAHNIKYADQSELIGIKEIIDLFDKELGKFQKSLANYERIRKFALIDKPFTIEGGEITPSMKLKRKVIEERYSHLIEPLYQE